MNYVSVSSPVVQIHMLKVVYKTANKLFYERKSVAFDFASSWCAFETKILKTIALSFEEGLLSIAWTSNNILHIMNHKVLVPL